MPPDPISIGIGVLGLAHEEERRKTSRAIAEADRQAAAVAERAKQEAIRQQQATRRDARRRTGRASTLLSASPLGVTSPIGMAAGGATRLGQ